MAVDAVARQQADRAGHFDKLKLGAVLSKRSPTVLKIGNDPCAASAIVAKHFWTRAGTVVVARPTIRRRRYSAVRLAAGLRSRCSL